MISILSVAYTLWRIAISHCAIDKNISVLEKQFVSFRRVKKPVLYVCRQGATVAFTWLERTQFHLQSQHKDTDSKEFLIFCCFIVTVRSITLGFC
jgi:hypothetical protein